MVDISASAIQMAVTQLSGAVIFFLLSNSISKHDIGIINWSLAILMIAFAALGWGIDQLTVKKIATGSDPVTLLKPYLLHILLASVLLITVIVLAYFFLPLQKEDLLVFFLLSLSQVFLFLSVPFKQVANGLQQFRKLLIMSVTANIIRLAGLLLLLVFSAVSTNAVIVLYVVSSLAELFTCLVVYTRRLKIPVRISWSRVTYFGLLKESWPQLGVIFFTTIIARFDWVLLGILSTPVSVADYSFTYRLFELATLPLLILGPLLLPRIAKIFGNKNYLYPENNDSLIAFIRTEMLIAVFTILVLNSSWSPLIDWITNGKYGAHNARIIFILSLSIPFLYINNILWSLEFSRGKLKAILFIFMLTAGVNLVADILLVPSMQATGAAIGFLLAMVIQTILYLRRTVLDSYQIIFWHLLVIAAFAWAAYAVADWLLKGAWERTMAAAFIYTGLLWISGKLSPEKRSLLNGLAKI